MAEDRFLFAFAGDGTVPLAFDLADASAPTFLADLFGFTISRRWWVVNRCMFADVRTETISVDVFCTGSVYSVRLLPDVPALRPRMTSRPAAPMCSETSCRRMC